MATSQAERNAAQADVIFADQRLGDMTAAALVANLRESGVTAPIVFVAAVADERAPLTAGAAALVTKPIARRNLVETLAALAAARTRCAPPDPATPAVSAERSAGPRGCAIPSPGPRPRGRRPPRWHGAPTLRHLQ